VTSPGQSAMYWEPGLGIGQIVQRYAVFYAVTSLIWDLGRAGGNFLLLMLFGAPILRLLRRFRQRFRFEVEVDMGEEAEDLSSRAVGATHASPLP